MGSRARTLWIAMITCPVAGSIACGGGEGSTSAGSSSTAPEPTTTSGAETSSGADTSGPQTTGPAAPMLEPGACGNAGDGFACGWAPSELCADGTAVGGPCDADAPCCLDGSTLLVCECLGNACQAQWSATDCTHGPGAGACGWDAPLSAYVCGGGAEDPGGSPMECPAVLDQGCDAFATGTSCCDPDGNAVVCAEGVNGGDKQWAVTDCVLDP